MLILLTNSVWIHSNFGMQTNMNIKKIVGKMRIFLYHWSICKAVSTISLATWKSNVKLWMSDWTRITDWLSMCYVVIVFDYELCYVNDELIVYRMQKSYYSHWIICSASFICYNINCFTMILIYIFGWDFFKRNCFKSVMPSLLLYIARLSLLCP